MDLAELYTFNNARTLLISKLYFEASFTFRYKWSGMRITHPTWLSQPSVHPVLVGSRQISRPDASIRK